MFVEREAFARRTLDVIVLPDIPSSALLKRRVHDDWDEWRSILLITMIILPLSAALTMWFYLFKYTAYLGRYNPSKFWNGWGLWFICFLSWVGSFCVGYSSVVGEINEMLYGESAPVSLTNADSEFEEVHDVQSQFLPTQLKDDVDEESRSF